MRVSIASCSGWARAESAANRKTARANCTECLTVITVLPGDGSLACRRDTNNSQWDADGIPAGNNDFNRLQGQVKHGASLSVHLRSVKCAEKLKIVTTAFGSLHPAPSRLESPAAAIFFTIDLGDGNDQMTFSTNVVGQEASIAGGQGNDRISGGGNAGTRW